MHTERIDMAKDFGLIGVAMRGKTWRNIFVITFIEFLF